MKIRNGFVSNSSSSSYIVALPEDFDISDEEVSEWYDGYDDDKKKINKFVQKVRKALAELKKNGKVWDEYAYTVHQIIDKFEIETIDTGPDDGTTIVNVLAPKYGLQRKPQ